MSEPFDNAFYNELLSRPEGIDALARAYREMANSLSQRADAVPRPLIVALRETVAVELARARETPEYTAPSQLHGVLMMLDRILGDA